MPTEKPTQSGHAESSTALRRPPLTTLLILLTVATTLSGQAALTGASGGDWFSDASRRQGGVELREERRRDPQPTRPRADEAARSLVELEVEAAEAIQTRQVLSRSSARSTRPERGLVWRERMLNLPPPTA